MDMGKIASNNNLEKEPIKDTVVLYNLHYYNVTHQELLVAQYNDSMTIEEINSLRIQNMVKKISDTIYYVSFETGTWALSYGYANNNIPYGFLWKLVFVIILLILLKSLLLPIALIYLIYKGVRWLIMRLNEYYDRD